MAEKRPDLNVGDEYEIKMSLNAAGLVQAKVAEVERYYVTLKYKKGARYGGKPVTISRQLFWRQVDAAA